MCPYTSSVDGDQLLINKAQQYSVQINIHMWDTTKYYRLACIGQDIYQGSHKLQTLP